MGIPKNYFKDMFSKLNVSSKGSGVTLGLDFSTFGAKLDRAQDKLDERVWSDIQTYMPFDSGSLISDTNALNQNTRGEVYLYPPNSEYGHYQYEGVVYEDPDYHVGGFYNEAQNRWWSRPGIKKIKTDRPLKYKKETAMPHWDEVAMQNHKKEWIDVVRRELK